MKIWYYPRLGQIALRRGRLEQAADYFAQALVIHREVQDRQGQGVGLYYLAVIAEQRNQLNQAEDYHQQGLALARYVQDGPGIADTLLVLGTLLIEHERGRDEGCRMINQSIEMYTEMGLPNLKEAQARARRFGCLD